MSCLNTRYIIKHNLPHPFLKQCALLHRIKHLLVIRRNAIDGYTTYLVAKTAYFFGVNQEHNHCVGVALLLHLTMISPVTILRRLV